MKTFSILFIILLLFATSCSSAFSLSIKYTYNSAGNLTGVSQGELVTINYSYDAAGNLLNRVVEAGSVHDGDVDHSGTIELLDTILILQILSGIDVAATIYKDCDVNDDSVVGLAEAIYTLQRLSNVQ